MLGRGVPRKGMEIVVDGKRVGLLTSGTFSPLLKIGIGMGYIPPEYSDAGTEISVMIRRRLIGAEIVKLPFYDEGRYGWRREKK
jgi:aminomethyltransferase